MAMNFPNVPTEGQIFAPAGGPKYTYQSPHWVLTPIDNVTGTDYSSGEVTSGAADTTLAEWMEYLPPSKVVPPRTDFFSNVPEAAYPEQTVWRMRERVFIGDYAKSSGARGDTASWTDEYDYAIDKPRYPSYICRDSTLAVSNEQGGIAVGAATRSSDKPAEFLTEEAGGIGTIGVGIVVVNDAGTDTVGSLAWGGIIEGQHESPGPSALLGWEIDIKNKSPFNMHTTPYSMGGGTYHLWLAGGGDFAFGGEATYPGNCCIAIVGSYGEISAQGPTRCFNVGIQFQKGALAGCDGTTGTAEAISMAKGHYIQWWNQLGAPAGSIRSDNGLAASDLNQVFNANRVAWYGGPYGKECFSVRHVDNGVNFLEVRGAIYANTPHILALGDNPNIDLALIPKGTGTLQFSVAYTAGITAITGYMQVRDKDGNMRKLAVIA